VQATEQGTAPPPLFVITSIGKNGGHRASIIGGTYTEEVGGPLRRVFAVLHDVDPASPGWIKCASSCSGSITSIRSITKQRTGTNRILWHGRATWSGLLALGATGDPCNLPSNPPTARCRAYIPPRMHWEPMKAFHDFMIRELEHGVVGRLLDPPCLQHSTDWVDYEFILNRP
jgi:hypothetical protein